MWIETDAHPLHNRRFCENTTTHFNHQSSCVSSISWLIFCEGYLPKGALLDVSQGAFEALKTIDQTEFVPSRVLLNRNRTLKEKLVNLRGRMRVLDMGE